MRKELYINNILADIDDETTISLQYQSFLFTGISDIQDNRSWTVSLKKTQRNLSIANNVQMADSDSDFPYSSTTVSYYVDGFSVITNGKAILLSISDKIEWVFYFGTAFEKIKSLDERKLTEITEVSGFALNDYTKSEEECGDWFNWNRNIIKNNFSRGVGYAQWAGYTSDVDVSANADIPYSTMHPAITANKILSLIERDYSIDLTELKANPELDEYVVPLKGDKSNLSLGWSDQVDLVPNLTSLGFIGMWFAGGSPLSQDFTESVLDFKSQTFDSSYLATSISLKDSLLTNINNRNKLKINLNIKCAKKICITKDNPFLKNGTVILDSSEIPYTLSGGWYLYNTTVYAEFESNEDSHLLYISFLSAVNNTYWYDNTYASTVSVELIPQSINYCKSTTEEGFYPIIPNLPDMSCADFIFQCMQILAVFPYLKDGEPDKVFFRSCKSLYDNLNSNQNISFSVVTDSDSAVVPNNNAFALMSQSILEIDATTKGNIVIPVDMTVNVMPESGDIIYDRRVQIYHGHGITDFTGKTPIDQYLIFGNSGSTQFVNLNISNSGEYTIRAYSMVSIIYGAGNTISTKAAIGYTGQTNITVTNDNIFKDWSKRLIKTTNTVGESEKVEFTFGDYKRKNWLDYKDNADNPQVTSDYLEVQNTTLENSQDLVKLLFAAPQIFDATRLIEYPLYNASLEGSNLKLEYLAGSYNDIIAKLNLDTVSGNYRLIFPIEMYFNGTNGIKSKKYTEYQKIIRKPRFLTEKMRITPYDLQNFDPAIPIYLSQYGKYYAIMTMQVDDSLNAEVELLELKEI